MFNKLYMQFRKKLYDVRPFVRTKIGSRLALIGALGFILLFFAPLFHGFAGAAIFGCVGAVYLVLIWRHYDREHAVVPAVFLSVPMLLDMAIYHSLPVISAFLVAIVAMFIAALAPTVIFFDKQTDTMYTFLVALGLCVAVVVAAALLMILVSVAWWILCLIAFLIVVVVFIGVVRSTAAYTASDGRRQAKRRYGDDNSAESRSDKEKRYSDYRPRERDHKIYNLDEDDFTDL